MDGLFGGLTLFLRLWSLIESSGIRSDLKYWCRKQKQKQNREKNIQKSGFFMRVMTQMRKTLKAILPKTISLLWSSHQAAHCLHSSLCLSVSSPFFSSSSLRLRLLIAHPVLSSITFSGLPPSHPSTPPPPTPPPSRRSHSLATP